MIHLYLKKVAIKLVKKTCVRDSSCRHRVRKCIRELYVNESNVGVRLKITQFFRQFTGKIKMLNTKQVMESAALRLFRKSDKENKGFIVKRDMQRMKDEIALSPEQLEMVFDTLDCENNGYLTIDQFLNGFREYLIINPTENDQILDYLEEPILKNDFNDELKATLNLIKGTNILKTSADDLEYISEQMRTRAGSHLSQWELFLKDLYHDLLTYKEAHQKLEKLVKQKEIQHQNYIKKMFEEVELQLKEEREKEEFNEQIKKRIKEEIKILRTELATKDELLQQLNCECRDLKKELVKLQKKDEKTTSLNNTLLNQQNYYEAELEAERAKRDHIQGLLENIRRRFSIEKSQCFKDGFNLARKVIHIQEEGLIQQLQILEGMQRVLRNKEDDGGTK